MRSSSRPPRRPYGRRPADPARCDRLAVRCRRPAIVALASLALLTAACGTDEASTGRAAPTTTAATATAAATDVLPAAVQHLEIDGTEYAFDVRRVGGGELQAGWTRVTFNNLGDEPHQVMFAALKPGVDVAELAAAAEGDSSGSAAIEFVDMLGGVSYVGADQTVEAMIELPEGMVLAMCYVPDPDGVAHALSGMSTTLMVGPGTEADVAGDEPVVGTITMGADGYDLPSALPTGWYRVVNEDGGGPGEGLHELSILGLEAPLGDGDLEQLLDDLASNATPDVELDALGGMGALSGGFEGYLHLDLAPGPYLAVDFMPDPGDPRPHLLDGYVALFEA